MATTRIKASNQATMYHRFAASNDAPQSDVGTNETLASKLGSSGDFELKNDDTVLYTQNNLIVPISGSGEVGLTALASPLLIHIKHSGFQEAAKTTATAAATTVIIGVGGAAANGFISLYPNESICLHAPFGSGIDNCDDIDMKSSSGSEPVFMEILVITDN